MARRGEDVRLKLKVDGAGKASSELTRVQGAIKGVGIAAAALGTAFAALRTMERVAEFGQLAGAFKTAEATFNRLSEAVGRDGVADFAKLEQAADGMIGKLKLMQLAVQATNADLGFDGLVTAIEFVTAYAQSTGQDFEKYIDRVVTGLIRGSAQLLDDVGINVMGAADVTSAAIDQMRRKMKQLGADESTSAIESQRLAAEFNNLKLRIGELIDKPLASWMQSVANSISQIGLTELERRIELLKEMGLEYKHLADQLKQQELETLRGRLESIANASGGRPGYSGRNAWDSKFVVGGDGSENAFGRQKARLARGGDPGAVQAEINRTVAAMQAASGTASARQLEGYRAQIRELEEILVLMTQIARLESGEAAGGGGGGGGGTSTPGMFSGEKVDLLTRFREEMAEMSADVALGNKSLADREELLEQWGPLLKNLEGGSLAFKQEQVGLNRELARQSETASGQALNAALRESNAALGTSSDILTMTESERQERLVQSLAVLETLHEQGILNAEDERRLLEQMDELKGELTEAEIERVRQVAGIIDQSIGNELRNQIRLLMQGENQWDKFFQNLWPQLAMMIAELTIIKWLIDAISGSWLNFIPMGGAGTGDVDLGDGVKGGGGVTDLGGKGGGGFAGLNEGLPIPGPGGGGGRGPIIVKIDGEIKSLARYYVDVVEEGERQANEKRGRLHG